MKDRSPTFFCISTEDGETKTVNEEYIRSALSGHYKNIDVGIQCVLDGIPIRTPFELFTIKR